MDVSSRTAELCLQGAAAEFERRLDDARRLYSQAWDAATDDDEACIAAHYVAHLEPDPAQALRWNLEALARAHHSSSERAPEFMGSLYVNLGRSYELVGDTAQAERYYRLAENCGVAHQMG